MAADPTRDYFDTIEGYFIPPTTTNYVFFIAGADRVSLFQLNGRKHIDGDVVARILIEQLTHVFGGFSVVALVVQGRSQDSQHVVPIWEMPQSEPRLLFRLGKLRSSERLLSISQMYERLSMQLRREGERHNRGKRQDETDGEKGTLNTRASTSCEAEQEAHEETAD